MISVLIPHKANPWNDACLRLTEKMLKENTRCEYELLVEEDTVGGQVYTIWNRMAKAAKYPILVWGNSDVVFAPQWDSPVISFMDSYDYLGFYLVECGMIGVHSNNIHRDFGSLANTFDREGFESFAKRFIDDRPEVLVDQGRPDNHQQNAGFGWYSPSAMKKKYFLDHGGFGENPPFPHNQDSIFMQRCYEDGMTLAKVRTVAYHFQMARENYGLPDDEVAERLEQRRRRGRP